MNSETVTNCPHCNAPVTAEAPQGLCPKCLLAAASIATEAGQKPESSAPASVATVAAAFPQLEILEFIGQGGMGMVFKARQPKLDRFVALKLLPQKPGVDPSFCERFNREARVLARLSHPNIVAVHDFGEAGPFFYLLMEFVDGVNLRQALKAGRFSSTQALALVPKICDALQYAHEEGVLHRDIKPENLLLDARGRLKIADFGIAKLLGETKDITLTGRGGAIGTPHYMAPEQIERPHDVDQRADIYSLGVVFYEMLTGELPIGRFAPPSEKAPMDPRVDQVVLRTLEKERERRFPSAREVKTHVEHITGTSASIRADLDSAAKCPRGEDIQAPPVIPASSPGKSVTAPHWSWTALGGAGLIGISLLLLVPALAVGIRVGPNELVLLCLLVGLPALTGTILGWSALYKLQHGVARRGGTLAFTAAIAWPLSLVSFLLVLALVLCAVSLQSLFHIRSAALARITLASAILGVLAFDVLALRHWLRRWQATRALPHEDLLAVSRRVPRRVLWSSAIGFVLLALFVLFRPRQSIAVDEPAQAPLVQIPNAPPGYEVDSGNSPGNEDRVFRSSITVPPGYALTVAPVFLSNQVPVRPLMPNAGAVLIAPEGQPVHAQLSWRLLGGTTLADGAPLQFSVSLLAPLHADKSFHLVPPEPMVIDWAAEPAQLWPPQNGHTRFLLMKGASPSASAEVSSGAEWAVAVEERLDPIPEGVTDTLLTPQIVLGTNWAPRVDRASEVER
jgi:tRNA A-37 threonylcarbamoyl transferase component Bud32